MSRAGVAASRCHTPDEEDGCEGLAPSPPPQVDFGEFVDIVLSSGEGGGSGWWARFLEMLRGGGDGDGADNDGGGGAGHQPELVRLESEADVESLIARFTAAFRAALDALFDRLAEGPAALGAEGEEELVIPESAALAWLELINRELGRGGTRPLDARRRRVHSDWLSRRHALGRVAHTRRSAYTTPASAP